MTTHELVVYEREGAAGLARLADRQLAARKQHDKRVSVKAAPRVKAKAAAEAQDAAFYAQAKREAAARATRGGSVRCEWIGLVSGTRCTALADDPDHVLGGRFRKECEALGAEGLQCLCRGHHDYKHGPDRQGALDQAKEHALRHGYRRLLRLVEQAIARYEAKHPEARRATP
jgi:hypothetical protein